MNSELPQKNTRITNEQYLIIDQILLTHQNKQGAIMVILNDLQNKIGYISPEIQDYVAKQLRIPVSKIHGVVSFYSFFTTAPRGKHVVKFCMGTACYVGGADQLIEKSKQLLKIDTGQTTPDGQITLEVCRCVGACSQAPVIVVDENAHGRVKPNKIPQIVRSLQEES